MTSYNLGLLYNHSKISDQQLYLLLTIILALSQSSSFMKCVFSLQVDSKSYSFYVERTEKDPWSVGCLLIVLMIRILSAHIHQINVPVGDEDNE